jgi:hypothetical protein
LTLNVAFNPFHFLTEDWGLSLAGLDRACPAEEPRPSAGRGRMAHGRGMAAWQFDKK